MSRDEAIKELTELLPEEFLSKYTEAIKMGIEALEQEPCEDAISRQAVIDTLTKTSGIRGDALKALYDLPSVTPQPKMVERWIPVSERLPNFAGVYLVTRYFPNNVMNPTYLVDACFFDGTDTWHDDNRINHYLTNVVAWLEEPEPYKEIPTGAEGSDKE